MSVLVGMAVLNSRALQEQLSAIMGALTKAVVAQICELVDEGYSLLQTEISRSRKENQDLKKKLHLIESIVVRGGARGAAGPESSVSAGNAEPQPDTEHGAAAPEAAGGAGGGAGGAVEEVNRAVNPALPRCFLLIRTGVIKADFRSVERKNPEFGALVGDLDLLWS